MVAEDVAWEKSATRPWDSDAVPPPLVELGKHHGVAWPADENSRFLFEAIRLHAWPSPDARDEAASTRSPFEVRCAVRADQIGLLNEAYLKFECKE